MATYVLLLPKGQRKKLWSTYGHLYEHLYHRDHLKLAREEATRELYGRQTYPSLAPKKPETVAGQQSFDSSTKIERVIAEFTRRHLEETCSANHIRDSRIRFRRVLRAWKGKDIHTITKHDVLTLVDGIADQGKPYAANRTLQLVSAMFNWAIGRDLLENNPARGVRRRPERPRERVLSDPELALVWHGACALSPPWRQWFKLLILLPNRRTELASMRWTDIDLPEATWTLKENKSRRVHVVPLSPPALEVLATRPQTCPWVFTTTTAGPIKDYAAAKRRIDAWLAERVETIDPWRINDLRRTCATNLIKLKVLPHIVETTLNHKLPGTMFKHYAHHAFVDEKRQALDQWAQHVAAIAERYKPAPTERELHQAELLAAVRATPSRYKSLEEVEAAALASLATS
jgi:integrase